MILCHYNSSKSRRGLSLVEIAFVLLVMGAVLSVLWLRAGDVYRNMEVAQASKQINMLVMAIRQNAGGKINGSEDWAQFNLPQQMLGHFNGRSILFNPWHGLVTLLSGNAIGWGLDHYNEEFTLRYDGVPTAACKDMVLQNASQIMRNMGLVAVYLSPEANKGTEICFATDAYCKGLVTAVPENLVEKLCGERSRMTVMFTYTQNN